MILVNTLLGSNNHRRFLSLVVSFLILFLPSISCAEVFQKEIHVWIKSFIPSKAVSGNLSLSQTEFGDTVITAPRAPIPSILHVPYGSCFATDNRGYSQDINAPSRVTTEFIIKIEGKNMEVVKAGGRDMQRYGITRNVHCKSGKTLRQTLAPEKENMLQARGSFEMGKVKKNNFERVVFFESTARDPFYPKGLVPRIDYSFSIKYNVLKRTITFDGSRGIFPAFEGYVEIDGQINELFKFMPKKETSVYSLFDLGLGINIDNVSKEISIR